MRRTIPFLLTVALGVSILATAATADDHGLPEHPHVLVLGLEFDEATETPLSFKKCIDLAANQALPLNAQHQHMHFGTAGEALFVHAGHGVAPTAPFPGVPWANCEDLIEFFFGSS